MSQVEGILCFISYASAKRKNTLFEKNTLKLKKTPHHMPQD